MSIVESVLETAEQHANGNRITKIGMRIGALTNVVPEALNFAFECAVRGTLAENASLEVEYLPTECFCESCQSKFTTQDFEYLCKTCGTLSATIVSGRELTVSFIEVEQPD